MEGELVIFQFPGLLCREKGECDYIWVKIKFHSHVLPTHIGVFYFASNTNTDIYTDLCDVITSHIHGLEMREELLILKDFNSPTFLTSPNYNAN